MTDVGLYRNYNIDPTSTNPLMFACVSSGPAGALAVRNSVTLLDHYY
eukprot:COSAG02_NODE_13870_length_1337_cov_1.108239_3_plen_47_part_00